MIQEEIKNYYQLLKDNGDLKEIFPKSKGDWEKDSKEFINIYNENLKFIENFKENLKFEEEKDEYFYE